MNSFRVLYQDADIVAIDKPAGFYVHRSDDPSIRVPKRYNCMTLLREQMGCYVYPAHRLDRATSGALLFGLNEVSARHLAQLFEYRTVQKTYFTVVRGWVEPKVGIIDRPLKSKDHPLLEAQAAQTDYEVLATLEWPIPNSRYATSRYSLLKVSPRTGRTHQIRRHLAGIGYPLIGDTTYGDREHNQIFKQRKMPGLLLKAQTLGFVHPLSGERVQIESRWSGVWHELFDQFGVCPFNPQKSRRIVHVPT